MSDLSEFLLARIAEDDEAARDIMRILGSPDGVRFSPARVLAECDAKRRIVARQPRLSAPDDVRDVWWDLVALLALPYANHPDYRDEWRL